MARPRAGLAVCAAVLAASAGAGWWLAGRGPARTTATVTEVVDGDTVVVALAGRTDTVRLLGVDTPETVDPDRPVECFGPEAAAYTRRRLLGREVELERDVEERDRYGRLLAYVFVGGRRFNDELLRGGYATLLVIPPNGSHARALLAAELDARAAARGLWSAC